MSAIIFNDVHIGVKRTGGTTPRSAFALRNWIRESFQAEILKHTDKHLVINGDLFDGFQIETSELLDTVDIFKSWLDATDKTLYLGGGNHDFSAKGDKVSSFQLLGHILTLAYPEQVQVFMEGLQPLWNDKVWIIPHQLNQDLFDLELERAQEQLTKGSVLFLHCNYDNKFAVHSDHSLNLSLEQAYALNGKGINIIIAHEHAKRVIRSGKVYITGNQFPSSVSDCLDDNGAKFAHILNEDLTLTPVKTWDNKGGFVEVDWTQLNEVGEEKFIRVSGSAPQASSEEIITTLSKFRQGSDAFVITNAVKIEGLEGMDGFEEISLEQIKGFDVENALLERLEPREQIVIKKLLEGRNEA